MTGLRIGMIGVGEMGAGLAHSFVVAGHEVFCELTQRSEESKKRAEDAGIVPVGSYQELSQTSDIVFSVLPTQHAKFEASRLAEAMEQVERKPAFIEANAVSPARVIEIAELFARTGSIVVDAGIVGPPPNETTRPHLYACGPDLTLLRDLDGTGFDLEELTGPMGTASAFKMTYAAMTKGTNALLTNVMLLAETHGFLEQFVIEIEGSQPTLASRARNNISRLPCDAARWIDEMNQIADCLEQANLPREAYDSAAKIMQILAASPFGNETRQTRDKDRDMESTIRGILNHNEL
ncbi:MAG: NAD(P)-binding domain-containing protein [Pseudomonadota bacterium]